MRYFFFTKSILWVEMLRVIVWGRFSPGLNCPENISVRGSFFEKVEPATMALFKKRSDIKKKQFFN